MTASESSWQNISSFDEVEERAILAGVDQDGVKVYVGRAFDQDGNFTAAKIVDDLKLGFYVYNNSEFSADDTDGLEYLEKADEYAWVDKKGATNNAVIISGSKVGRALYNDNIIIGHVDDASDKLIASYKGIIVKSENYEVLVWSSSGE